MDQTLYVDYRSIARFFEAAEGNYRNAFYVSCHPHCPQVQCGDFLFIPDFDCKPIIIPVTTLELFCGSGIDKTDCACIITIHSFLRFYQKWLADMISDSRCCPIPKLLEITKKGKNSQ